MPEGQLRREGLTIPSRSHCWHWAWAEALSSDSLHTGPLTLLKMSQAAPSSVSAPRWVLVYLEADTGPIPGSPQLESQKL